MSGGDRNRGFVEFKERRKLGNHAKQILTSELVLMLVPSEEVG